MPRRPALFTQADLARVFQAAKRVGMAVRVDLVHGTADVIPVEDAHRIDGEAQGRPVEPRRPLVL